MPARPVALAVAIALASAAALLVPPPSRASDEGAATRSPAVSAAAIDLARHRVRSVEIPIPPNARRATATLDDVHLYRNELLIDGIAQPIPLARSMSGRWKFGEGESRSGFDAQTLKLEWLAPGELLWITWTTPSQGQGGYLKQGAVLLERAGDVWRELFRDSIYAYGSVGSGNWMSFELTASWEAATRVVTLTTRKESSSTSSEAGPLDDEPDLADSGAPIHVSRFDERVVRRYAIRDGALVPIGGEKWLELEKPRPASKVAEAYEISLDEIVRLNPGLARDGTARGAVRVADRVEPYRFESDDGICETPCPQPPAARRARRPTFGIVT